MKVASLHAACDKPAMERTQHMVTAQDDGSRLDRFIARTVGNVPHGLLQKTLRKGLIRVDGKKCDAATRLATGQVVELRVTLKLSEGKPEGREKKPFVISDDMAREAHGWVIHKDKDILVINKPAGLAVQGGSGITKHLDALLPALCFDAPDAPRLVHRLDKDTSGVMLLARHRQAAATLQRAFADKTIQKYYLAVTVGVPNPYSGEIESNLDKLSRGEESRELVRSVEEEGKRAITRYRVVDSMAKALALVELEPVTGRTHQLRVHMAEMGCPIAGDGKYGGGKAHVKGSIALSPKLHLMAWRIELPELFGKPPRSFEAPVSPHIAQTLEKLGLNLEA